LNRKWKIAAWTASIVVLGAVAYVFGIEGYRKAHPEAAFSALVGVQVPAGVRVTQYASAVNDNLFHTAHFWLLEGDADSLRKILAGTRFGRSDEDARWFLPEAGAQFDLELTPKDLAEGYESDDARNRWFLILEGQHRAIYVL